jgi:hypothetical protein
MKKIPVATWRVYQDYLSHATDYFEGFEKLDFEEATILDELNEIKNHFPETVKEAIKRLKK